VQADDYALGDNSLDQGVLKMGISPFAKSACACSTPAKAASINPKPDNFAVVNALQVGQNCVALIRYPDAKNYEGQKIMLYLATQEMAIRGAKRLDPHFCDRPHQEPVPFARFAPTAQGWHAAVHLAALLQSNNWITECSPAPLK